MGALDDELPAHQPRWRVTLSTRRGEVERVVYGQSPGDAATAALSALTVPTERSREWGPVLDLFGVRVEPVTSESSS